jgi:hypothetical protein
MLRWVSTTWALVKVRPAALRSATICPGDLYCFYRRCTVLCTLAQRENLRERVFRA